MTTYRCDSGGFNEGWYKLVELSNNDAFQILPPNLMSKLMATKLWHPGSRELLSRVFFTSPKAYEMWSDEGVMGCGSAAEYRASNDREHIALYFASATTVTPIVEEHEQDLLQAYLML